MIQYIAAVIVMPSEAVIYSHQSTVLKWSTRQEKPGLRWSLSGFPVTVRHLRITCENTIRTSRKMDPHHTRCMVINLQLVATRLLYYVPKILKFLIFINKISPIYSAKLWTNLWPFHRIFIFEILASFELLLISSSREGIHFIKKILWITAWHLLFNHRKLQCTFRNQ